jgi:hypothetical protein
MFSFCSSLGEMSSGQPGSALGSFTPRPHMPIRQDEMAFPCHFASSRDMIVINRDASRDRGGA